MKHALVFLGVISILFNLYSQNIPLYIGTYTNGESEGIYKLAFDSNTGDLTNLELVASNDNPSFLAFTPDKKYLYSVNEVGDGFVSSFEVTKNGKLKLLNKVSSNGEAPCHVAINETGDKAVVSNYSGGTVSIYSIKNNGSLSDKTQVFNHNSSKEKSHVHFSQFFENDLFVSDLGRNAIYQYKLENSIYKLENSSIVEIIGNQGPRHFAKSKDGNFIYSINEYGSSITTIKKTNNEFEQIDDDSTLSKDYKGNNFCADIHLSKDERFVYGSNRGENSIAVFKRDSFTGELDKIQNIFVEGNWPRNFTLDPSGKFMLVANQRSSNISVFKIHTSTGKLTFLRSTKVPNPVCLVF